MGVKKISKDTDMCTDKIENTRAVNLLTPHAKFNRSFYRNENAIKKKTFTLKGHS